MIRKRVEETDDQGRTVTTITEEPDDAVVQRAQRRGRRERNGAVVGERNDAVVEEYDETTVDRGPGSTVAAMITMLSWWAGLAGIVVFALLALRLSFETGHANSTRFVDYIYHVTGPLVRPFEGIANARTLGGGGIFHPETAIAMGVYLVAMALVVMALRMLAAMAAGADDPPVIRRSRIVQEQH